MIEDIQVIGPKLRRLRLENGCKGADIVLLIDLVSTNATNGDIE